MTLIRDVMTQNPRSVPQTAAIDVAIDMMVEQDISGVPVVDEDGLLVGLITEHDVLCLYDSTTANTSRFQSCHDLMVTDVRTIDQNASLEVAAKIFHAATLRRLLVVDGDELVGVLSRRDVVKNIRDSRLAHATNG